MKDPYEVLGLRRDASLRDIEKSFRRIAQEYHPDKHGGDAQKTRVFCEAKAAYDYLRERESTAQEPEEDRPSSHRSRSNLDEWAQAYNQQMMNWARLMSRDGGYITGGDWTCEELEERLMKFFDRFGVDETIMIDSKRQRFQIDGLMYWMSKGLAEVVGSETGDQASAIYYGLTPEGK